MLPVTDLPPLEYRWTLDAVMPFLNSSGLPYVICHLPVLKAEIDQRLLGLPSCTQIRNGLWVEPMLDSWHEDLQVLSIRLEAGSTLVLLTSQPLAHWLPERRSWPGKPLGLQLFGLPRLHHALRKKGFLRRGVYGLHGLVSIWLNFQARQAERRGHPEVADRLQFSARLHYLQQGRRAVISTVAFLLYRKVS